LRSNFAGLSAKYWSKPTLTCCKINYSPD
jgi:hypothetical protein